MLLYRANIENFRNIDHININFSDFNVLIGENNIGKTNILTAINKVLSKNVYFKEDDFKILEKPIIIELSFNNLSDEDKAAFFDFEGLYNPEDDDITIKTIGTWRSTIGNADISVNFIRKDLDETEQEVKPVTKAFRKTFRYSGKLSRTIFLYYCNSFSRCFGILSWIYSKWFFCS